MAERKIRVVLADDHPTVRRELSGFLSGFSDIDIVGEAADGQGAVDLTRELQPDVVVMDVFMPGMNGIEATRVIRLEYPQVKIVALSMYDETEFGEPIRLAGAAAYISKVEAPQKLVTAVRNCQNLP